MPQFVPVVERITTHIVDTLKTVRTVNGYSCDLTVRRMQVVGNAPTALQYPYAVVVEGNASAIAGSSHDQSGWYQNYAVDIHVDPAEDLTEAIGARLQRVRADVEKALTLTDDSRTRGGLAFNTAATGAMLIVRGGSPTGVRVMLQVQYYTQFNDPYRSAHSNIE